ncbi:mechanosensitive ion channel domain-containing protein [Halomicrobium salinisoli]|uniref:mechanosensitive ion channel domain-containing protein n=1 Tax=Halomicrobium salinisoli TaxID=2878391 RepID=UPI001CF0D031|nr:mechanosensitive ion channel domain-containing protein [Halomicrobium salinisoli]
MQFDWADIIRRIFSRETAFTVSVAILVLGAFLGYFVWRWTRDLMRDAGVPDAVEGTPFERTARRFGTSTVGLVSNLAALFVYVGAVVLALNVSQLSDTALFWSRFTGFLPDLFIAAFALILGLIAGDKAKLVVSERLRSVKLPEAGLLPELVKYSIFFLALLIALDQLGVATGALLILLAAYVFGLVFLSGLAFKDLLSAGAAGVYLVLTQPYGIGDEVRVDGHRGIVQEVGMFVTHIESDEEEYIVPNNRVFASGVVRVRS